MAKHSSHILELAKRGAALRLRELADELDILLSAFPDLHDAFDADELPVSFIMRRDARRAKGQGNHATETHVSGREASDQPANEEILGGTSHGTEDLEVTDRFQGADHEPAARHTSRFRYAGLGR